MYFSGVCRSESKQTHELLQKLIKSSTNRKRLPLLRFTGLPLVVLAFHAKLLKAPLNGARHILLQLRLLHVNFPKIQNKHYVILSRTNYPDAYRIAVVSDDSKWQLLFLFLVNFFTGKTRCKLFRFLQLVSTISLLKRNSSLLQQT